MVKAYVLMELAPGADLAQLKHTLKNPGVVSLDLVMGPYDVVAVLEANDLGTLGLIATQMHKCPGIKKSITCPVIS